MELRRFYIKPTDINGDKAIVSGDEFLHMTKVLRLKKGFKVIICANDGIERFAVIDEIFSDYAMLTVTETKIVDKKNHELTLFAGILKNNKFDIVLQKAVELGVDKVVPFISANTAEMKFNLERAKKIALEAAKQCGAAYLTEIEQPLNFKQILERAGTFDTTLIAYENERKNRIKDVVFGGKKVSVIVGSEGGFKLDEVNCAIDCGAVAVTLGRRVLRAETAGIVTAALILNQLGELDYD